MILVLIVSVIIKESKSNMSKGTLIGIVLGAISCGLTVFVAIAFVLSRNKEPRDKVVKKQHSESIPMVHQLLGGSFWEFLFITLILFLFAAQKALSKFEGVKGFSFAELEAATDNFNMTSQIGQGGYGKVYKGILADGTVVAVKRAQGGSSQGEREFFTEIELLSRVHHRNLVSLVGYCDEEEEQVQLF